MISTLLKLTFFRYSSSMSYKSWFSANKVVKKVVSWGHQRSKVLVVYHVYKELFGKCLDISKVTSKKKRFVPRRKAFQPLDLSLLSILHITKYICDYILYILFTIRNMVNYCRNSWQNFRKNFMKSLRSCNAGPFLREKTNL